MNLELLKSEVTKIIDNIKNHGIFNKENSFIDYKLKLNHFGVTDETDIFLRNFSKDILSFTNNNGGIILIGFDEDSTTKQINDIGLNQVDIDIFSKIDLNIVTQKFDSITKCTIKVDLQQFQISARKFYYILIEKNNDVTIPINDFIDYKLKKGEIIYRVSGKNELANENSHKLNSFLQLKANEKSKEFMEIWSKLLPEIFDINPKEILMINPKTNNIYGYNQKDKNLSSSEIEIDKSESGVFNIILNAISAGEIGKISDTEGKPLYKIVGEIKSSTPRDYITLSTLDSEIKKNAKYNFTSPLLKLAFKELGWTNIENFHIEDPEENILNEKFSNFIWIENIDTIKDKKKVVFSKDAIEPLIEIINDKSNHVKYFKRNLHSKQ
ncbi:Putative DNA-binding domain-containing protein [Chryseobacterium oranimense]|uniref:Putative DNA-binding domain-containing protein n=1 Tax=Chryseobacterium oranimense TaxID=421058 RepID=A0A1M5VKS7_9FLAO|nr:ATP-binding protein [Chryseobacterium oranimense]SHH75872.1 Putative DNA-binding domain-containing protein [Chryseobacterium oranimense]